MSRFRRRLEVAWLRAKLDFVCEAEKPTDKRDKERQRMAGRRISLARRMYWRHYGVRIEVAIERERAGVLEEEAESGQMRLGLR